MLVSLSAAGTFYFGETDNLKRSLRKHNSGYGDEITKNTDLHPFGVFAFISGFDGQTVVSPIEIRHDFFELLRRRISSGLTLSAAYDTCVDFANEYSLRESVQLVVVKCGEWRQ